jgi:hypothetical protein
MSARYPAAVYPLEFDEQSFSDRARLARYLSSLAKRSANATALMLIRLGDDPVVVLSRYRQRDGREFARIGSRSYPTRRDFSRYVARYFRIPTSTVEFWLKRGQSVDEVLARAKERRAQLPPSDFPNPRRPVTIFGWRFRSYNAMCRYYRRGSRTPEGWREQWVQHIA